MPYFKLSMGYNCGIDKSVCTLGYPDYCIKCIFKKFSEQELAIDNLDAVEQKSEEKKQEMIFRAVWRKYQDILNIRHVIILNQKGLAVFNLAVGDEQLNAQLLSGFIQANVIFSSEGLKTSESKTEIHRKFYEFQYKDFNILLSNGKLCRICLILEEAASENLRELLSNFTDIFEDLYKEELFKFEVTCNPEPFNPVKELIQKTFEIYMIYPQTLVSEIPPSVIENLPLIQKALYEYSKDLLKDTHYFFIPILLTKTLKLLGVISKEEILWNIYQMLRNDLILSSKDLEFQRDEIKKEERKKRENEIQKIIEIKDIQKISKEARAMTIDQVQNQIKLYLKKGDIASKDGAYQEALNEYQIALKYSKSKEIFMKSEVGKIAFKIIETMKLNKKVELDFANDQANKFEKKKDYAIALKYLFEIRDYLIVELDEGDNKKKLIKLDQRINKLQQNFLR